MAYSTIRTALKTRLAGITGVKNVHEYLRYVAANPEDPAFASLFQDTDKNLNAWQFTRTGSSQVQCLDENGDTVIKETHTIRIEAMRSIVDGSATENTFQDLLDTVKANFAANPRTLSGACHTHSLLQLTTVSQLWFNGIASHQGVFDFQVTENV